MHQMKKKTTPLLCLSSVPFSEFLATFWNTLGQSTKEIVALVLFFMHVIIVTVQQKAQSAALYYYYFLFSVTF
jgi:hypothetical protein